MEKNIEKSIDVLNDLIQINNDRIEGYKKAIEDTKAEGSEYDALFHQMMQESANYKQELTNEARHIGGKVDWDATTNSGKIYRMWMDIKSTFTGKSGKSALELCEFGEDAAQKAYKEALSADYLPIDTRQLILTQKEKLRESHDVIKRTRDMQKVHS